MKLWLKSQFKKAFTEAELVAASDQFIKAPPLPPEWRDVMAGLHNQKSNSSWLDHWRSGYRNGLKKVAGEPTWETQRRALLILAINEGEWVALHRIKQSARHVSSWKHMSEHPEMQGERDEILSARLDYRVFPAALNVDGYLALAKKLYGASKDDELSIIALREYGILIRDLDARALDVIMDKFVAGETDNLQGMVDFHEQCLKPILADEYRVLAQLRETVLSGSFDFRKMDQSKQAFDAKVAALSNG